MPLPPATFPPILNNTSSQIRYESDTDSDNNVRTAQGRRSYSFEMPSVNAGIVQADSDTSSDEEESMSSTSSAELVSRPSSESDSDEDDSEDGIDFYSHLRVQEEDRTPRKITRKKVQLLQALRCVFVAISKANGEKIIEDELRGPSCSRGEIGLALSARAIHKREGCQGTASSVKRGHPSKGPLSELSAVIDTPWTKLVQLLSCMKSAFDSDSDTTSEIKACSNILHHLVQRELLPLSGDKGYIRTLNGIESRSIRSFRSIVQRQVLPGPVQELAPDDANVIIAMPPFLHLRLISFALHAEPTIPRILDLSRLPIQDLDADASTFLREQDFHSILRLVGVNILDVHLVDLSNNRLRSSTVDDQSINLTLDSFFSNFPFVNIEAIDLRYNPKLKCLPLGIVRLPHLQHIFTEGTRLTKARHRGGSHLGFSEGDYLYRYSGSEIVLNVPNSTMRLNPKYRKSSLIYHCVSSLKLPVFTNQFKSKQDLEAYNESIEDCLPERYLGFFRNAYACDRCLEIQLTLRPVGSTVTGWIMDDIHDSRLKGAGEGEGEDGHEQSNPEHGDDKVRSNKIINILGRCCISCKRQIADRHRRLGIEVPEQLRMDLEGSR
ncbi:uncharacterized protein I303_102147 [Kwoniella dejecticola CBS 10117]|uniref:Uncharacterized protein n=1 Tax=Kwoniella dejecticola CBS 10117 TaxID=1296121 RepID=A0A1A6ABS7_9TREE|nr:uncharacterized protein I303_01712 [Kwoniella dejecticola CBS 10117]OBR87505.1 hypothetical protein I303_01712 [Kwoniella dejecticola CBS 10117]